MTSRVYIGTAGRGTLQLDDGRTIKLNGFGGLAQVSDGTELFVSGTGYLAVPDMTTTQIVLNPTSGFSTEVEVTVSGQGTEQTEPTGTIRVEINGTVFTTKTLANGQATVNIPSSEFTQPGTYNIAVFYSGDNNYVGSSSSANFVVPPT